MKGDPEEPDWRSARRVVAGLVVVLLVLLVVLALVEQGWSGP